MGGGQKPGTAPHKRSPREGFVCEPMPLRSTLHSGPPSTTCALLSAAGRPTALDSDGVPKVLIEIEGSSLLSHVLRQLHAGGILNVVLVVSRHVAAIILETQNICERHPCLHVDVVCVSEKTFYAKSLLGGLGKCFQSETSILISTVDHIFDEELVREMCSVKLVPEETEVCLLVDFAKAPLGLPNTTIGVECDGRRVARVSREIGQRIMMGQECGGLGVEAGLFACNRRLFDLLAKLAVSQEYFTLTDAVQDFAAKGLASWLPTNGRKWMSVETATGLESTSSVLRCSPTSSNTHAEVDALPSFFMAGD